MRAAEIIDAEALAQQIGGRLVRAWALTGGASAQVTAVEIEREDGRTQRLVVHQYGEADLAHNSQIAADEFRLLRAVRAAGIPAPEPYTYRAQHAVPLHMDEVGESYLVVEYVEGTTEIAPQDVPDAIDPLAEMMARIHQVDTSDLTFLSQRSERTARLVRDRSADPLARRIGAALAAFPLAQRNPTGLLHGDFWTGNLLWNGGRIAAVIDWEDAALGDPLADVANTRLELLWAFGAAAMGQFTTRYQTLTQVDFADLRYWDLAAALHPIGQMDTWAANADAARVMCERHAWFAAQALEN